MKVTRRRFLQSSLAGLALAAAGCAAQPAPPSPPAPTAKPAEAPKPPEPTKAAAPAPTKAAAPAPAATAAPQAPAAEKPQAGGQLTLTATTEPASLDPSNSNAPGLHAISLIFNTLIVLTKDLKLHPGLAESWEVSPDGKTYTFKLKRGVKFHDGTPFNAAAVKFSIDRTVQPTAKATFPVSLQGVYEGTEVVDDFTARVKLKSRFVAFLDAMADWYYAAVSPTAVQKLGKDFDRNPVGTGPFIFQQWASNSHITIKRNPDYNWTSPAFKHQGPAYLETISWRLLPEATMRSAVLETGEVQVAQELLPEDYERLQKEPAKYRTANLTQPGTPYHLQLTTIRPPLDELPVRQAIAHGINNEAVVQALFRGSYKAAKSILTPVMLGYDPTFANIYPYNPAKAREILDKAGWVAGPDGIRVKDGKRLGFEFNVLATADFTVKGAELLQAQLREVGFDCKVVRQDSGGFAEGNMKGTNYSVFGARSATDPDTLRLYYHSEGIGKTNNQRSKYRDPELDRVLEAISEELDRSKREALVKQVQQIIGKAAIGLPLWDRGNLMAYRTSVRDFDTDIRTYPVLYDAWLAK